MEMSVNNFLFHRKRKCYIQHLSFCDRLATFKTNDKYLVCDSDAEIKGIEQPLDINIYHFRKAIAFGENDLILHENSVYFDDTVFPITSYDPERYKRGVISTIDWNEQEVVISYNCNNTKQIRRGIWLGGLFSYNYYHFFCDIAYKLLYVDELKVDQSYPILIDEIAYERYREIVNCLNKSKRKIIIVKANQRIKINDLICVSACTKQNRYNGSRTNPFVIRVDALIKMKERIFSFYSSNTINPTKKPTRKIYISRKNVPENRRRLTNEDQVENLLIKYGYEIVCTEELSFEEEVSLFSETISVISIMGAGLMNVLFLPKQAHLIQINTAPEDSNLISLYTSLAKNLGIVRINTIKCVEHDGTKNQKENDKLYFIEQSGLKELEGLIK